jgi:hypothetical protein
MAHTLYLLLGLALLVGGFASAFLMFRYAGISDNYITLIHGGIAQALQVRLLRQLTQQTSLFKTHQAATRARFHRLRSLL